MDFEPMRWCPCPCYAILELRNGRIFRERDVVAGDPKQ
jgi:hypothetical protein